MSNFTINILGTASALPTVDRYPSAQVLDVHGRLLLIDCGEGAQMMMRKMKIAPVKIEAVFISHIHGDHVFGLFGLLSTMGMQARTTPLHIYAPNSFGPILKFFLSYFGEGIAFPIEHHVLKLSEPQIIYESKSLIIRAFPLRHRIETYGFIFSETLPQINVRKEQIARYGLTLAEIGTVKRGEDVVRPAGPLCEPSADNGFTRFSGTDEDLVIPNAELGYLPYQPRSYAYCSDTMTFPELAGWVKGVDLLYHEATYPSGMEDKAEMRFHSTTVQAARCAHEAGAKRLLLGHYSSKYPDLSLFLGEAREVFPDTLLANEGDRIEIPIKSFK
ncbi:MAG: ribonuclease Z [Bacteroidales bacterium]|nr:ribonuclease Z [Bacteroidales bacterium]